MTVSDLQHRLVALRFVALIGHIRLWLGDRNMSFDGEGKSLVIHVRLHRCGHFVN
jgi:hypothetical protein